MSFTSSADIEKAKRQKTSDLKKISSAIKELNEELEIQKKHADNIQKLILLKRDSLFVSVPVLPVPTEKQSDQIGSQDSVSTAVATEEIVQVKWITE